MTALAPQPEGPQQMESQRFGSRWLFAHPDEQDVKTWFDGQRLHPGMDHEPYYGGIVVIGAQEKVKQNFQNAAGAWLVREVERMSFTPYVKVDTRIAYFHDLVAQLCGEQAFSYIGVIEPVPVKVISDRQSPYYNEHLPVGYFMMPVRNNTDKDTVNRYIGARWRVAIYERESWTNRIRGDAEARPLLEGVGTKQTLLVPRVYADDNALMKAETGAIGRALGVAGILVVGTGVATAEDMQELQSAPPPGAAAGGNEPVAPDVVEHAEPRAGVPTEGPEAEAMVTLPGMQDPAAPPENPDSPQEADERLRARARELGSELQSVSNDAYVEYTRWYTRDRKFPALDQLSGPALNGAVVKLERVLDEARLQVKDVQAQQAKANDDEDGMRVS